MNSMIVDLVFLGVLALAGALAYRGWVQVAHAIRSGIWPEVQGQVISSHVAGETRNDDGDYTVYQAQVTYAYTVGDRKYIGSRVAIGMDRLWGSEKAAMKYCARMPQGRKLYVAYDPGNPAQSVLQAGLSWTMCVPLVAGVLALLVSTGVYLTQ